MARNAAPALNPHSERDWFLADYAKHPERYDAEWIEALRAGERVEYVIEDADGAHVVAVDDYDAPARKYRGAIDDSPEAVAARAAAKQRKAEAIAYVNGYTGTWGLILDLRADRKWGTKHMRMSDRLVDVLLEGKARDEQRAKAAAEAPKHPRYDEAIAEIQRAGSFPNASEFVLSLARQVAQGRTLTDRQVEALLRNAPTAAPAANGSQRASSGPKEAAAEGFYSRDGVVYKVQHTLADHDRRYAKRLVIPEGAAKGSWEYANGIVYTLTEAERLTVEQAAEYGRLYGICMVCGRELTDEASIAAGIGPVCGGRLRDLMATQAGVPTGIFADDPE